MTKSGFAGSNAPQCVFPTLTGQMRHKLADVHTDPYVGDEAQSKRGILSLSYPVHKGHVDASRWMDMERILHHTIYNELRVCPEDCGVVMTENPFAPAAQRKRLTKIMFETFGVPSFHLAQQAALSLYCSGRVTGLVLDCGYEVTHAVPLYEGIVVDSGIRRLELGGKDVTDRLLGLMSRRGYSFTGSAEVLYLVNDIKESLCSMSIDYAKESMDCLEWKHQRLLWLGKRDEHSAFHNMPSDMIRKLVRTCRWGVEELEYVLPDGQSLRLGKERITAPEFMFSQHDGGGVSQLVHDAVMGCNSELRSDLWKNVVISGGN